MTKNRKSYGGIERCRNFRNLYLSQPDARPVPVKVDPVQADAGATKWVAPSSLSPHPVCLSGVRPQQRANDLGDFRRFQRVLAQWDVGPLRIDDPDLARMPSGQRLDLLGIAVGEDNVLGLDVDPLQLPVARQDPQLGLQEQVLGGFWQRSEPVVQLLAKIRQMVKAAQAGQPAIELELHPGAGYIILGQVGSP